MQDGTSTIAMADAGPQQRHEQADVRPPRRFHPDASLYRNPLSLPMHNSPPFLPDPDARRFREMRWGCGWQRAVLVVERDDETEVNRGIWR